MLQERDSGCSGSAIGCGCSGSIVAIGVALGLFGLAIAGRASMRIPFTDANITWGGSMGAKDLTREASQSAYISTRIAGRDNFLNTTHTATFLESEWTNIFIIGKQEGAPAIDLGFDIARRDR